MTTNNKWEEETKDEVESFVISILDAENQTEQNQAVEDFMEVISKIENEAYNRGKEERKSEWIKKTEAYYWKDIIPLKIKETHQETLEKVKEVIESKLKEKLAILKDSEYNTGFEDSLTDLLQELNNI